LAAAQISRVNCDEMAGNIPRQTAYETFSVKRGWWRGEVGNAFWMKRSYSTPGPVST